MKQSKKDAIQEINEEFRIVTNLFNSSLKNQSVIVNRVKDEENENQSCFEAILVVDKKVVYKTKQLLACPKDLVFDVFLEKSKLEVLNKLTSTILRIGIKVLDNE